MEFVPAQDFDSVRIQTLTKLEWGTIREQLPYPDYLGCNSIKPSCPIKAGVKYSLTFRATVEL
ncbi:hypothetical protein CSKR_109015, partial [Clonorchis sinensis]